MNDEQKQVVLETLLAVLRNSGFGPNQGPLLTATINLRRAFDMSMSYARTEYEIPAFIEQLVFDGSPGRARLGEASRLPFRDRKRMPALPSEERDKSA